MVYFLYFLILALVVSGAIIYGSVFIPFSELIGSEIFFMRIERVITAFMVGSGLSLSGSVLQRVLKNPLADPYILGISGGSSLGAAASLFLISGGLLSQSIGALAGSFLAAAMLIFLKKRNNLYSLPLIGVALNSFFASLLLLLLSFANQNQLFQIQRWMLGSLQNDMIIMWPISIISLVIIFVFTQKNSKGIIRLSFGYYFAKNFDRKPGKLVLGSIVLVCIVVSFLVSMAGPIGFVGIIYPHIARFFHKDPNHEFALSFLGGGIFLIFADLLSRTVIAPQELPLGVITALVGAPALLWILKRSQRVHYAN